MADGIFTRKVYAYFRHGCIEITQQRGYTGNASFSPYQAMTTYKYDADLNYGKGIGAVPMAIGNPDLKWERTLTYNADWMSCYFPTDGI